MRVSTLFSFSSAGFPSYPLPVFSAAVMKWASRNGPSRSARAPKAYFIDSSSFFGNGSLLSLCRTLGGAIADAVQARLVTQEQPIVAHSRRRGNRFSHSVASQEFELRGRLDNVNHAIVGDRIHLAVHQNRRGRETLLTEGLSPYFLPRLGVVAGGPAGVAYTVEMIAVGQKARYVGKISFLSIFPNEVRARDIALVAELDGDHVPVAGTIAGCSDHQAAGENG